MINFKNYKIGDTVKFLDKEALIEELNNNYKGNNSNYITCVLNLAGQECVINDFDQNFSGEDVITLNGDNPNYYSDSSHWYFRQYMFEDPKKIEINNDIPNIFGDMIYG